jgi:hypothetical protein
MEGTYLRGFLILFVILLLLLTLMPFILGFVLFLIVVFGVFVLLARLGLLPGTVYRTYTFTETDAPPQHSDRRRNRRKIVFVEDTPPPKADDDWYQSEQDGEVVTLPESALKKDEDEPL